MSYIPSEGNRELMKFKCPGSCGGNTPQLTVRECPQCGSEIEMFSVDMKAECDNCGYVLYNDVQYCMERCPRAEECLGAELYRKMLSELS